MNKIQKIIKPILIDAYGDNAMARALIEHLSIKISDALPVRPERLHGIVLRTCWDWMSGGDTASDVADKIIMTLTKAKVI